MLVILLFVLARSLVVQWDPVLKTMCTISYLKVSNEVIMIVTYYTVLIHSLCVLFCDKHNMM